jgi:hypothetical protein
MLDMDLEELERTRDQIQGFPPVHQRQIYTILCEGGAEVQETNQGVLVNLGTISEELLKKISEYAQYVKEQEATITKDEIAKDELRESYFGATQEHA